jgi:hypothetical protein
MPDLLAQTAHRPYSLPSRPWVMRQTWYDLLFAHWPVPAESLRPLIPPAFTLDTFDGQAWVGVIPFGMRGVYPRWTFPVPWLSAFLELNVRTYVTLGGRPGVWFFSLDAANPVAVEIARRFYHLPYFYARMSLRRAGEWLEYKCYRTHPGAPHTKFRGRYRPTGPVYRSAHGSIDEWLTERYCLYAVDAEQRIYRGEIHHAPWPLQPAAAEIALNTLTLPHHIELPEKQPLLHFAQELQVRVWALERVAP